MKKILMATDLSARSDRALHRALMLARENGAKLEIVHVVDESLMESIKLQQQMAAKVAIEQQIGALPLAGNLPLSLEIVCGLDWSEIVCRAEEHRFDLIVLGIHRHKTRQMFQGTTAERVIRYGARPVLVVKDAVSGPYRRAVVAADLSTHANAAMGLAARLTPSGLVHLVHAAHRPFAAFLGRDTQNQLIGEERARITAALEASMNQLSRELAGAAPRFEVVLREGEARRVIREQVANLKPDLLAVGTHGRTGVAHAIIGSIAEDLLADAPVDVVAVKAA